jgi:hypothetical protein
MADKLSQSTTINQKWTIPATAAGIALAFGQPLSPKSETMTQPQTKSSYVASDPTVWMAQTEKITDLKIEAAELRTDNKFAELMGELKLISKSIGDLSGKVSDVKTEVGVLDGKIAGVASATASVKWNILTTGLVLGGLFIAVAAFGVQILDAAQGLFSAGAATK